MTYEEILSLMQDKYCELTGFDADSASDIGIRLKVLAQQVALLYTQMEEVERQSFPQTSTGDALERHAECRGLTRKAAQSAEGVLQFARETAATSDITIAAGVICGTGQDPQLQVETTEDVVLPTGQTKVTVPARACTAGEVGNVAAGAICLMVSAAPGLTAVTNPSPFTGGADEENDDQLRERLLEAYRNIANGTNTAFYYDIAMSHPQVSSAAVLPRSRGRGTVDVAVYCSSQTEQTIAELQAELDERREINVDVGVYAATESALDLTVSVAPQTGNEFALIAETCRQKAEDLILSLGVGEALLPARLTALLMQVDGVYNVQVTEPTSDIQPADNEILRPGTITVERMTTA